jgi:hypothetical protein
LDASEPVIILTTPRSYSTVATAVLSGHPMIHGFPELLLNRGRTVAEAFGVELAQESLPWQLTGLCIALADLHEGKLSDDSLERARDWLAQRQDWTTKQVMDHLLAGICPEIGLEKSAATVMKEENLDLCLRNYPNASYLHLTRHPVSAQRSMQAQWTEMFRRDNDHLAAEMASVWLEGNERIVRALAGLPARQWMRVRAEEMLRRPYQLLPEILSWLGLHADDSIIASMLATEKSKFAYRGDGYRLGGGDMLFFESPALREVPDPGPVSFDPAWGLPLGTISRTAELANYLGY